MDAVTGILNVHYNFSTYKFKCTAINKKTCFPSKEKQALT